MPNVHTPERLPTESQEQYRNRRQVSRAIADEATQLRLGDQHRLPSQREQMRKAARDNRRAGKKGSKA